MDDVDTETSADAPLVVEPEPEAAARPAHFGAPDRAAREGSLPAALAAARSSWCRWCSCCSWSSRGRWTPAPVVSAATCSWPASTSAGSARTSSPDGSMTWPRDYDETPVELVVGDVVYETTAADIGLLVDKEATTESALETGDSSFVLARPFAWALSLVSEKQAPLQFQVNAEQVAAQVIALEGDARTPPTEPTVELVDGAFEVVPGRRRHRTRHRRHRAAAPGRRGGGRRRRAGHRPARARGGPDPAGRVRGGGPGRRRGRRSARERAGGDHARAAGAARSAPSSCAPGCS